MQRVFLSGGTGYLGTALLLRLIAAGHPVTALTRAESAGKLPAGAGRVIGNALDPRTFSAAGHDTYLHLVGVPKPAPWKQKQFRLVDLASLKASVDAAVAANVSHFVYVSVAHPAPVMRSYVAVRRECERIIKNSGLRYTILRPWYVIGPGHRWPLALLPLYWVAERIPAWRGEARRLAFVRLEEMSRALEWAVANPPATSRTLSVVGIRDVASRPGGSYRPTSSGVGEGTTARL